MRTFTELVAEEVARARRLHLPIHSLHEGYAVIAEELDEFWLEVRRRAEDRDPWAMRDELVQVAAMCQRVAEDTGLMKVERP
jgi:hypothetical protein